MIQIITDSTADLPPAIAEREGILVVPAQILFGTEGLRDGVELTSEAFFERLVLETQVRPTTTLPLQSDFEAAFTIARARGANAALSIHLGSAFSGTCNAACLAAEEAPLPVTVLDSGTTSLALGWIAILSARAARSGATLTEVVALVERLRLRAALYAMLDTLEYLRRGGRANRIVEMLTGLLDIKPILFVGNNRIELAGRVRTRSRALTWLRDRVAADAPLQGVGVVHAVAPERAATLADMVRPYAPEPLIVTVAGAVLSTHAGPGAVGVGYVRA